MSCHTFIGHALLIQDDRLLRDIYTRLFQHFGLNITATSYTQAQKRIKDIEHYDLIITDIVLANNARIGLRFIQQIKKQIKTFDKHIPIILFTMHEETCQKECFLADIDEFYAVSFSWLENFEFLVHDWDRKFLRKPLLKKRCNIAK